MKPKTKGVIAAGHEKTVEAAEEIFSLGGNAFDAAIAAVLASFVLESTLTAVGGSGFLLAHTQDNRNILFDFFSQTPMEKKPSSELDFYPVAIDFGGQRQSFHIGLGSIAIPGNLAGVFAIQKKLGRLPLAVVAEPAIHYAKNGFTITKFQKYSLELLKPILLAQPQSAQIYAPRGQLLAKGDRCYMQDLAGILTELVAQGEQEFYQGEIGEILVKDCQEKGGYLTRDDLINYQVIERKPLKINYRNYEIFTNPPPSTGGILIAFALQLLEKIDLSKIAFGSSEHLEILAEVMRLTNQARKTNYDPYIYDEDISDRFLANSPVEALNKWGSTTHISVMDNEGNAASVTTTNGEGSSYMIPGTGIMLNNMLGEADLNPFGFHNWRCNQRISSMMSPTIIIKDGKPEIVLGSGGSNRIRTAILQVISNLIDFDFSLETAVTSSRVHWENHIFSLEPLINKEVINNLALSEATELILWSEKNMFFGGVHAVRKTSDGLIEGAGDIRRYGAASANIETKTRKI